MLSKIRETTKHYCPFSSWYREDRHCVYRGPFKNPEAELLKYQRYAEILSSFSEIEFYIPEIKKIRKQKYLVFPFRGSNKSSSEYFRWDGSRSRDKFFVFQNLIIRYLIGAGGGNFEMIFLGEYLMHINLDICKLSCPGNLLDLLVTNLKIDQKRTISNYLYENLAYFKNFIEELKPHLNNEELGRFSILKQLISSRAIVFLEVHQDYEMEKAKRGPKVKNQRNVEISKGEKRNRCIPNNITFENIMPKEIILPKPNLDLDDFVHLYQTTNSSVFKHLMYLTMLEFMSIEDLTKYLYSICKILKENEPSKIINLMKWLKTRNLNQELFIEVMKDSLKNNSTWVDVNFEKLEYCTDAIKYLPHHAAFFKLLSTYQLKKIIIKELDLDYEMSDIKNNCYIKDKKDWLFSCLFSNTEQRTTKEMLCKFNHLKCPSKSIAEICAKLETKKLPSHPSILYSIYNR